MSIEGIQKEYLFREKWYIKRKGFDLGVEPPRINTCSVHSPSPPEAKSLCRAMRYSEWSWGDGTDAIEILCYLVGLFIV